MALWNSILAALGVEDAWDFAGLIPGSADSKSQKLINDCYCWLAKGTL